MPQRQVHLNFDAYLVKRGRLPKGYTYYIVHQRIDKGVTVHGPNHRELDYFHSEEGLRQWLRGLAARGAYQEKLTAYLHCGLGHFALDDADIRWYNADPEGYANLPWSKVFEGALRSYIATGAHRKFFRKE